MGLNSNGVLVGGQEAKSDMRCQRDGAGDRSVEHRECFNFVGEVRVDQADGQEYALKSPGSKAGKRSPNDAVVDSVNAES
jgi:hypothetical protein